MGGLKLISLGFSVFIVIVIIFAGSSYFVSPHINNIINGYMLENYVKGNNLTLPYPKYDIDKSNSYYVESINKLYAKNITEFHNIIKENYVYTNNYGCKYWAYVWSLYWKNNLREKNWKIDYLTIPEHIFVMFYNEDKYCVANMHTLECYKKN